MFKNAFEVCSAQMPALMPGEKREYKDDEVRIALKIKC
jgi:hypothetical protein